MSDRNAMNLSLRQKVGLVVLATILLGIIPGLPLVLNVAVDAATFVSLILGVLALMSSAFSAQVALNIKRAEFDSGKKAAKNLVASDIKEALDESQRIIDQLCTFEDGDKESWNALVIELSSLEKLYEKRHEVSMFLSTQLSAKLFLDAQSNYMAVLRMLRHVPRLLISDGTASGDVSSAIRNRKKILCERVKQAQLELLQKYMSLDFVELSSDYVANLKMKKGTCEQPVET